MKRKRHTPGPIIRKLREVDGRLAEGKTIAEINQRLEISEPSSSIVRLQPCAIRCGHFGPSFGQQISLALAARVWYVCRHGHGRHANSDGGSDS